MHSSNSIKVSVIVPIYNVEEFLAECLDSLVAQSIDGLQVILIDDGSTDESGTIACSYCDRFPNFSYHRIKNGGLGHARNYGLKYAQGEYICFLDSDDVIPSYAYEEMYELGKKHSCDIVTGGVTRFNSTKESASALHRKAFSDSNEITHVTESPNLLYDTTSTNKLFNREFFEANNLVFPEGILYEDIPVTVPAHFMARRVACLNKTVYYWRIRDGVSLSITQRRTERKNFLDRLSVIKMVDAYFDKHIADKRLHHLKNVKWLDLDFNLYIKVLDSAEEDFRSLVINEVAAYIEELDEDVFSSLKAIDRIKYHYIRQKDIASLLNVVAYEKKGYKTLSVKKSAESRFFGDFPFRGLSGDLRDMTDEIKNEGLYTSIDGIDTAACRVVVRGQIHFSRLSASSKSSICISALLVDEGGNEVSSIPISVRSLKNSTKVNVSRMYKKVLLQNLKYGGYEINLGESLLSRLAPGRYRIRISYSLKGFASKDQYLKRPVRGWDARPYSIKVGANKVSFDYNYNNELLVIAGPVCNEVNRADLESGVSSLLLPGVEAENVDKTYSSGRGRQIITSTYENDYLDSVPVVSLRDEGDVLYAMNRMGKLECSSLPQGAFLKKLHNTSSLIRFEICLPCVPSETAGRLDVRLTGLSHGTVSCIPTRILSTESGHVLLEATLDLEDSSQTCVLRGDTYVFEVEHGCRKYPVYSVLSRRGWPLRINADGYCYSLYGSEVRFKIGVKRLPEFFEKTKVRKSVLKKVLYPLFRRLPLWKNVVVFESSWGEKTDCNPGAISSYILENHPEYKCYWSLNDPRIAADPRVKKVRKGSLKFFYVMARTSFLVNNVNFIDAYVKRKGQIEIQTMHGTPLKTLGLDVPGELPTEEIRNAFIRRCARWDYLIVQSEEGVRITRSCYAYQKKYLKTGYPRNDSLFRKNNESDISSIKERLGLSAERKFVLYAPTWRVRNKFDLELDLARLSDALGDEFEFGIRVHQFALAGFNSSCVGEKVHDFSYEKSMEDLLLAADVLITDYSSVMFDYALLGRPILFFVYDLEDYRDTLRGFNLDFESEAPGPLLKTTDEVLDAISCIEETWADSLDRFEAFTQKYCTFDSGNAAELVFNQVFKRGRQ